VLPARRSERSDPVFDVVLGRIHCGLGFALGVWQVVIRILGYKVTAGTIGLVTTLLIFGVMFTLFAMWFDMESNKELR